MKRVLPLTLLIMVAFGAAGQNNPAVTQATTTQQRRQTERVLQDIAPGGSVPALYPDEDADVGPQFVLRKRKPTWVRLSLDSQVLYTDNMQFQRENERDAGVAITSVEAALTTPSCITRFASYRAEAGYRHQFFNYFGGNNRDDFDFDASTAFADVVAQTAHYEFRAGIDYTRLLGFEPMRNHDYEEFYHEWVPRWSVQRNFRVCDRSMISLAYLGSYHFADEDPPMVQRPPDIRLGRIPRDRSARWEHTFLAAYSLALPRHFVVQPYYRYQFTDFVNLEDCVRLHTLGVGVGWIPCESFAIRAFFGYNWQRSDNRSAEYEKLDAGAGVNLTVRF
jgi:hypothetical protein